MATAAFIEPTAQFPRRSRAAFTLLEVLVTIGLIALLAGVLVGSTTRLLNDRPVSPEEVFRTGLLEARKLAVEGSQEVRLSFDAKEKRFTVSGSSGSQTIPTNAPKDMTIEFLVAQRGGNAITIAGTMVETQTVPYVTFYSDGTCSPFRVQFRAGGDARVIAIDPWTCAPILESGER